MKNILIISFSVICKDPRVMRQIQILAKSYNISVVGYGSKAGPVMHFFELRGVFVGIMSKIYYAIKLLLRRYDDFSYEKYLSQSDEVLSSVTKYDYDVIVANDVSALPFAFSLSRQTPVILDAHEYSPREFEDKFFWPMLYGRYYMYLCSKYFPKLSGMMTVCQSIADEYERNFGIKSVVVTNAPSYRDLSPSPVQHDIVRMIHHGAAIPSRHLEDMIEMMNYLDDRFTIDFMLVPSDKKYMEKLSARVSSNPKIRLIEPVLMQNISDSCNKYDIGVFLLRPVNFNYQFALPNKFFEFIQSRLAVAIGPSPEMARIVKQYNCGIVSKTFAPSDLADKLNGLTSKQIQYFKSRSHEAAKDLCAETNAQAIIDLVEGV